MEGVGIDVLLRMLGLADNSDDPSIPSVLESNDIEGLVKYMKSDQCNDVIVMLGAGVSTAAGIPDFRSPDTGLYANLARLNLPYPEAVFHIQFFKENPHPFYALAKELFPGKFRPTITHSFIKLLADKGLLRMCFTQNIDTLERRAGIPEDMLVEAHGSFATHRCIECKESFSDEEMKNAVNSGTIPHCVECDGLVKPNIVFFGESLPESFHRSLHTLGSADLLIVIGTSLVVHPFASIASMVPQGCPRILINMEPAGGIGEQRNDIELLGKCDDIIRQLADKLDWTMELDAAWAATALEKESEDQEQPIMSVTAKDLKDEVDKLADDISSSLNVASTNEAETGVIDGDDDSNCAASDSVKKSDSIQETKDRAN